MKRAVLVAWILAFIRGVFRVLKMALVLRSLSGLFIFSCILFIAFAYFVMYRETRLQQEKIKTQQLPQQEVERFNKQNKALKTTVFVVGAVIICLLPLCFCLILLVTCFCDICPTIAPVTQTCAMLNSLVNPLIYCWRQKEMRKFIFRSTHVDACRGYRYPVKEGNVKEMVDNLISTYVKFCFGYFKPLDEQKSPFHF